MKLLSNPFVPMALGLVLGAGVGVGFFLHEAKPLMAAIRERQAAAKDADRPEKPWDFWTLEIENIASELKDGKATLAAREQAVAAREERLAADLRELEKTRRQIEFLRTSVMGRMVELETEEIKNLKTLAKTYSELSPKAAVGILQKLDESTAVKILHLMKNEAVSAVLQEMGSSADPQLVERAAQFTDRLRLVQEVKASSTP
jgi:flagellar motility protein MotE (MotC chaperone)